MADAGTPSFMSSTVSVAHAGDSSHHIWAFVSLHRTACLIAAGVIVLLLVVGGVVAAKYWPFSRQAVIENLAEASDSNVTIRGYKPTYFPSPGCILDGVEFRHGDQKAQFITIEKLTIEGSYSGILTGHIPRIIADGARVFFPPFGSNLTFNSQHSKLVIDELVVNGTGIEFASKNPQQPSLRFDIHQASLTGVQWGSSIAYQIKFHNPNPPGEIAVAGKFGRWIEGHPDETKISGDFTFDDADLGVYDGIAGKLASQGKFDGILKHINVSGTTDIPDFRVKSGGHAVNLTTKFDAYVDGTKGDTFLNRVEASYDRTAILAEGAIAGSKQSRGKEANIHLTSRNGRIEDLLQLFVTAPRPMSGAVSFDAHATLLPGKEGFFDKLRLTGVFGIDSGTFTHPDTQLDVDKLSAGARGKNKDTPEDVVSNLKGHVELVHGAARFSSLTFSIPGADAKMHGTYNVINHGIDLHGNMRVATRISKTSTGMKSFILKVIDPLFRKKKKGEIVPVHIEGTYEKPEFGLDMTQPDNKKSPPQSKP
ncbi:MAG: AsmA-like C-terminal region-containing protein [Candidatus Sulfotelmatobacter sp.]